MIPSPGTNTVPLSGGGTLHIVPGWPADEKYIRELERDLKLEPGTIASRLPKETK